MAFIRCRCATGLAPRAITRQHQRPPWDNPVLFAIAADASRYNDWIPTNQGYRYGVFNPEDGVGTPFFGGYYGRRLTKPTVAADDPMRFKIRKSRFAKASAVRLSPFLLSAQISTGE